MQLAQQEQDEPADCIDGADVLPSNDKRLSVNPMSSTPLMAAEGESSVTPVNASNSGGNQVYADLHGHTNVQGFLAEGSAFLRTSTEGTAAVSSVSRTLSDGLSSRGVGDHRAQLRHASAAVGEVHAPPVRELVTGQFIKSGGIDNIVTSSAEVAVGNTYVMTDDAGMVLVNGSTANGNVRS